MKFKVWKVIKIGTFKTHQELLRQFDNVGRANKITESAKNLIRERAFYLNQEEKELKLAKILPIEVGYHGFQRDKLYECVEEAGLELCPPEVAIYLTLFLKNDTEEILYIGMEPIYYKDTPFVFIVEKDKWGKWLNTTAMYDRTMLNPFYKWVFVLPREQRGLMPLFLFTNLLY
jgi:hypothetical protein